MTEPGAAAAIRVSQTRFSLDDFCARATARLRLDQPAALRGGYRPGRGDRTSNSRRAADPEAAAAALPAAVLVPVVARPGEATMLLTRRADGLRQHSGQIAFPGGKIDAADASPVAAALREAHEEIGLAPAHVEPIGYLDPYPTGTGFLILPVVGIVRPPFELSLNAGEVDEAFEVPLGFLMEVSNHQRHERQLQGRLRQYYVIAYGERNIWGITAGILRNLYERLYA